ncbi:MAG: putative Serine/threonine-protein phosphatase 5 [Streblomastix strix]|uniref:Serine/threonine-protein phosphatase n=1 Tax=Streblomastix strix TaxID=222440 RepID=A0A5J4WWE9_9EUKA|nr:MAG: putative Serine/threonine-protein phosphatase 5 [Streblomastix strix]
MEGSNEVSVAAQDSLIALAKNSEDVRNIFVKIGFIETARYILLDETTQIFTLLNVLDVLYHLIFFGQNARDLRTIIPTLTKIIEDESEERKEVVKKAKMVFSLLKIHGQTGLNIHSSSLFEKIEVKNEENSIQIEEQKLRIYEMELEMEEINKINDEKQQKIDYLEKLNLDNKAKIEQLERKEYESQMRIEELKAANEPKSKLFSDLKSQGSELKTKFGSQSLNTLKLAENAITITVPLGSYIKKDKEFTYTSTGDELKTFQVDQMITYGVYRCVFKINQLKEIQYFGILKSGTRILFGFGPLQTHFADKCMEFSADGRVCQNGKEAKGNQAMKEGDIIAIEVNMDAALRTVRLFINGVLQPVYMSKIPKSIQYFFYFSKVGESVTVISLKRQNIACSALASDPFDVPNPVTPEYAIMLIDAFRESKRLKISQVNAILSQSRKLFEKLPNIIEVNVPEGKEITLVGDIYGQFFDLLHIFTLNGKPSNENPYLFLGNYVDKGSFGTELFLVLLCFKLAYPKSVHLLRGNHESMLCTKEYGFKNEVEDKYNTAVYQNFLYIFNALPICSNVNKRIFVVHGGLFTRFIVRLDEIRRVNRFTEPGEEGGETLMAQMLWSDPMEQPGQRQSQRHFGCSFGPNVTDKFLDINQLQMIIRSNEVRNEGYSVEHGGKLMTLFSAPSHMYDTNKGAFLRLSGTNLQINPFQYSSVSSPPAKNYYDQDACRSM